MKPSPLEFDLPHPSWREHQYEAVEWALNSPYQISIMSAPVGSGKSPICAALGSQGRSVTAVTPKLALQQQFAQEYGFRPLYGTQNYDCEYNPMLKANHCAFERMYDCPVHTLCHYLQAREAYKAADRATINYHYYLAAGWLSQFQKDWIVLDEAHEIRRFILDYLTLEYSQVDAAKEKIPLPPQMNIKSDALRLKLATNWLQEAHDALNLELQKWNRKLAFNKNLIFKIKRIESKMFVFENVMAGISEHPDQWYAAFGDDGIKIAPLTAAPFFKPLFTRGWYSNFLLMSGTIGDISTFAKTLGIDSYGYMDVPHRFPPERRPVFDLKAPRMSHGAGALAYEKQATLIADAIKSVPHDWSGILHVNSRKKAKNLGERLAKRGLQDRLYLVEGQGTKGKLDNWYKERSKNEGALGITFSFREGIDLRDEKINISCDVPFAYLGDPIEKARANYDGDTYRFDAAVGLEQRNGRTRRGREIDYDTEEEKRGLNAIADSNYNIVYDYLSQDFRATIQEWV